MENIFQRQTAANASLHCLLACGVSALPVKPVRIALHYGVQCLDYATPLQRGEGGRIIRRADGRVQIVLDPSQPSQRRRFAVVHELGHYLLGHLDRPPQPADEYAADCFAAGVLMPACVLRGLHVHKADDIAYLCSVTRGAAETRAGHLQRLYRRGDFSTHPLEPQVLRQFEGFLEAHGK